MPDIKKKDEKLILFNELPYLHNIFPLPHPN